MAVPAGSSCRVSPACGAGPMGSPGPAAAWGGGGPAGSRCGVLPVVGGRGLAEQAAVPGLRRV